MEKTEKSQANLRKRKMLLAMPLLLLPFFTLGFWALGGGKGARNAKTESAAGLNSSLPGARLKEEKKGGKLSFYDQAAKDSAKLAEWMRSDPYHKSQLKSEGSGEWEELTQRAATGTGPALNPSPYDRNGAGPEALIMEKLARLQKGLDDPPTQKEGNAETVRTTGSNRELNGEVNRLEQLMEGMKRSSREDPGMERIESVMDKILGAPVRL